VVVVVIFQEILPPYHMKMILAQWPIS